MTGTFARRLAALRRTSGESLQDVASSVGGTKAHIWELEKGSSANPGLVLMKAIAKHFGTSVGYLAGEKRKP